MAAAVEFETETGTMGAREGKLSWGMALVREADAAAARGDDATALDAYKRGLGALLVVIKLTKSAKEKKELRDFCVAKIAIAERCKEKLPSGHALKTPKHNRSAPPRDIFELGPLDISTGVPPLNVLSGHLAQVKDALMEMALPLVYPELFVGRNFGRPVLIYGAPGIGKSRVLTSLSRWLHERHVHIVRMYGHDLYNRTQDLESVVSFLLEILPCTVLLEEIDAVPEVRTTETCVFLETLSRMPGVLVVATSNSPWSIPPVLQRRFSRRLLIDQLSAWQREQVLREIIGDGFNLSDADVHEITARTELFTPSDLSVLVRDLQMVPIRELLHATHFRLLPRPSRTKPGELEELYVQCSAEDPGAIETTIHAIDGDRLFLRPVTIEDFRRQGFPRPTVSEEDYRRYRARETVESFS